MTRVAACALATCWGIIATSAVAGESPRTIVLRFDAQIYPSKDNLRPGAENLAAGDTLDVVVDPRVTYGTGVGFPSTPGLPRFLNSTTDPGLVEIPVLASGSGATVWLVQPGAPCTAIPLRTLVCDPDLLGDWEVPSTNRWRTFHVYSCQTSRDFAQAVPLRSLPPGGWCLDGSLPPVPLPGTGAVNPVSSVDARLSVDGADPVLIPATPTMGTYRLALPLRQGVNAVTIAVHRLDPATGSETVQYKSLTPFDVAEADAHSLVRIQAELLASNRLRALALAAAVTPVRREFFNSGPWSPGCVLLCTITPTMLLGLSSDAGTVLQLGGGVALFLNRAFQINAGVLLGTKDFATGWSLDRAWYVGFGIDPVLLSEASSASKGK